MFKKPLWQTVWTQISSGSTLFASILNLSVMLGNFLQQTTSADNIFRCIFFLAFLRAYISLTGLYFEHRNAFQKDTSHIFANIRARLVRMWIIKHSILKMKTINNVMVKLNESVYNPLMSYSDILYFSICEQGRLRCFCTITQSHQSLCCLYTHRMGVDNGSGQTLFLRPRGYKFFIMLNSTEHKISTAHKTKIPKSQEVSYFKSLRFCIYHADKC